MAGPRFHQPAVSVAQPHGSLQRLARYKVQEADEHGPLRQRVQGASTAEELWPRHVRQTEAGDDQRDRPASGAQPFENVESALRPQHREDLVLASEATLKLPGKARGHARIAVDDQDGGGALRFGHLRRVKDPSASIAPPPRRFPSRSIAGWGHLPFASRLPQPRSGPGAGSARPGTHLWGAKTRSSQRAATRSRRERRLPWSRSYGIVHVPRRIG